MHEVFISYAHQDTAVAEVVCQTLEENGISCWIAPRDILPGTSWSEAIVDAIEGCQLLLLIFSTGANESPQVCREIERAVNKGVTIMPLRVEDVHPDKEFEYFLGAVHWLDAWHPSVEEHLPHLVENTAAMLGRVASRHHAEHAAAPAVSAPTAAPHAAPKPLDHNLHQAGLERVQLKAGETLFHQGEGGDSMYILEQGQMDVLFSLPDGEERTLFTIEPTATLGEMSLLLSKPRTATVVAHTEAWLWRVSHEKFQEGLARRERWAIKLMTAIAQTLAHHVETMNQSFIGQMAHIHELEGQLQPSPAAAELEDLCDRLFTHGTF